MSVTDVKWLAAVLLLAVTAELLCAQESQRGSRDRRGERRQRDNAPGEAPGEIPGGGRPWGPPGPGDPPGGGMPWGPPGPGGPPGGGMPWGPPGEFPGGGMPGFPPGGRPGGMMQGGPGGWLTRLDANGNGMLDPEEMQGRTRMFLERTDLDLSRPIPMDRVTRAFEDMRGRRPDDAGRGGEEDGRRGRGEEAGGGAPESKPLVPGFGEVDLFEPVPAFGDLGEKYAVAIQEEDRQEALRTMGRSDTNQDGVLDADEIRNARWSDDPLQTDRNRDGKLTLDELALRYAMRRVEREGTASNARPAGRSAARGGANPGRGTASAPAPDAGQAQGQDRMVQMIFGRYDRNGNGVLDSDEWSALPSDPTAYDTNQDGKISREEFAAAMAARFGGGRRGGGGDGDRGRWFARRDGDETPDASPPAANTTDTSSAKKSYRVRTGAERLADYSDLPEWFARADANGDGQVSMAEYASSWNEQVAADFAQFDLNNDGIVTPVECLQAVEAGAVQGSPVNVSSDSESRRERRRNTAAPAEDSAQPADDATTSSSAKAASAGNTKMQKYVKWAVGFIKKYDTNNDGALTQDEWTKMPTDYSAADTDADGRITPVELAAAAMKKK